MTPKTVRIVAIVMLVVVCIAGAAALAYFVQQRRIEQLTAQLASRQAELKTLAEEVDRLESQTAQNSEPNDAGSGTESQADSEQAQPKPEPTTSRQFAFVRKATDKNGKLSLVVDFAQFLTGSAAAEAAAAAGDESPPPSDYYISNDNPKLRTFGVAPATKFVMAGNDPDDVTALSADEFYDAIAGDIDGAKDAPYWFTITNGVITAGEEQWTP